MTTYKGNNVSGFQIFRYTFWINKKRNKKKIITNFKFVKACIIFFDEIDAVGGARFDDGAGGDNEVQRTMLELINQVEILAKKPTNLNLKNFALAWWFWRSG